MTSLEAVAYCGGRGRLDDHIRASPPGFDVCEPGRVTMRRELSILAVDDEPSGLEALSRLLRLNGHHVVTAGTVADALLLARYFKFDLLISDLDLPDGTRMELLAALSAIYHCPAVALTGHAGTAFANTADRAGFAHRLVKPISFAAVLAAIEQILCGASR